MTPDGSLPRWWRLRLQLLCLVGFLLLALLAARLYQVQIVEGSEYARRARLNTIYDEPVRPPRGVIVDARGRVLVSNQPRYSVSLIPYEDRDVARTLRAVAAAMHESPAALRLKYRRHSHVSPWEPIELVHSLGLAELARVAPVLKTLPGVVLRVRTMRRYYYGRLASHVLGYTGEISESQIREHRGQGYRSGDVVGQSGLEESYDRALRGKKGTREIAMDAMGHTLKVTPGRRFVSGDTLHLTLDLDLQREAERALKVTLNHLQAQNGERTGGAVVVMNVHTGAVLAMAALPNFDPRWFARGITGSEYRRLLTDPLVPLFSRAIQAAFPPGSTFKTINASACLAEHVCTPTSHFFCSGWYQGFHCFVRSGHGALTFTQAIAESCDATFYMLGDHLGVERLARYARLFGLGSRTGVDLPGEATGIVPTPAWKQKVLHQPWWGGETIVMSIGQGYLIATPLQMCVVAATVANGGKVMRPYLVQRVTTPENRVVWERRPEVVRRVPVQPRYLKAVRLGMRGAVLYGTSTVCDTPVVQVAGKTGTAEAVPTVDNPRGRNHTWFISFAPYQKPELAIAVFIEKAGGYGGGVAAPIARDLYDFYFGHGKVPRFVK